MEIYIYTGIFVLGYVFGAGIHGTNIQEVQQKTKEEFEDDYKIGDRYNITVNGTSDRVETGQINNLNYPYLTFVYYDNLWRASEVKKVHYSELLGKISSV